uniref:Uncharacterized protein n=1 Tax=uncultured sulfate-reducing bacterium TaxID=153939 RepID=Q3IBJ2_9BACT|nr:hypothetical protein ws7f8_37 [uncultured sulfate-reducing bacterium]
MKDVPGAHAARDERIGEGGCQRVDGAPPGAVGGGDHLRVELAQRLHGGWDPGLEDRRRQVEAAHHRVHLVDPGELAGVAHGIDQSGVSAAGDDDETPVAEVGHQRLIVVYQRVRLPFPIAEGLLDGQPLLEFGGALDLPGHDQVTVQQGRWLPFLGYPEAGSADILQAGRGQLERLSPGDGDPPPQPHVGMSEQRREGLEIPREPIETDRVVEVAMAEDHGLDCARVHTQRAEIVHQSVDTRAGVEEHRPAALS